MIITRNDGFQVEPWQTVQQTEIEEFGKPEYPPVQHGRGELFGDSGPQTEPGGVEQPAGLQHPQTADPEVVGQPQSGRLQQNEHILRVRTDRGQTQQQQFIRRKRSAAQPQPVVPRRVF